MTGPFEEVDFLIYQVLVNVVHKLNSAEETWMTIDPHWPLFDQVRGMRQYRAIDRLGHVVKQSVKF